MVIARNVVQFARRSNDLGTWLAAPPAVSPAVGLTRDPLRVDEGVGCAIKEFPIMRGIVVGRIHQVQANPICVRAHALRHVIPIRLVAHGRNLATPVLAYLHGMRPIRSALNLREASPLDNLIAH